VRSHEVICTTDRQGETWYHVAPVCYCLLSRTPLLEAMFNVLEALLLEDRNHRSATQFAKLRIGDLSPEFQANIMSKKPSDVTERIVHKGLPLEVTLSKTAIARCWSHRRDPDSTISVKVPSVWRQREMDDDLMSCISMIDSAMNTPLVSVGAIQRVRYNDLEVYCSEREHDELELARWAVPEALSHVTTDDLLQLVTAYLLERQILVVAPDKGLRSAVILALLALCHPWSTPHTVLTIIPREHYMLTSAPTPYVFGVSDTEDIAPYIGADVAVWEPERGLLPHAPPDGSVELGIAAAHLCSSTADIRSRALPVAERHTPGPHRVDLSTILQGPCDDVRSSMLGSADDARNVDTAVRRVMGAKQKFHKLLCMLMLQFEEEAHEHSNHFVKEFAKTEVFEQSKRRIMLRSSGGALLRMGARISAGVHRTRSL